MRANLAVIHRVGYTNQSRSHFDSQDYMGKGDPRGKLGLKDGMIYRQLNEMLDLTDPSVSFPAPGFPAASWWPSLARTRCRTSPTLATSISSATPTCRPNSSANCRARQGSGDGKGVLGLYGDSPLANALYADLVKGTGQALGGTISTLANANSTPYVPNDAGSLSRGHLRKPAP